VLAVIRATGRVRDERGGVLVLVAVFLPVAIAFVMLVLETGNWWVHKRHLQVQADAAAFAGGAMFSGCFSPAGGGDTAIFEEASRYSGEAGTWLGTPYGSAQHNAQVGNANQGSVSVLYQSTTYAAESPAPDDTETQGPCETPSLMFDVKATEAGLPLFFGNFIPSISSATINAHARVQLRQITTGTGSLPLAVPEVNPKFVTATFVDESGDVVGGPVSLSGPTASGALKAWTGSGSVAIPAGQKIGVRIGVGQVAGTCSGADARGGTGYVCYDYSSSSTGLVTIAGFDSGGPVTDPGRAAFEVWPVTACSGSPFFSEDALADGATTCAARIQAVVHPGTGTLDPDKVTSFKATVDGTTHTLTHSDGVWTSGVFDIPVDGGPYDVSLEWRYQGGGKETHSDVQRIYSATDDSGPVKVVTLSGGGGAGAPYALSAGTHTVTVNVGIEGSLHLSAPNETIMLRLTGGSRTSAVACDGPGAAEFSDAVENGCETPYQINPAGYCPDPTPPSGPADCIPTKTGSMVGPTEKGLDTRFAACPPYDWPNYQPDDPRIVKLMITDFSALDGSGSTEVPVTNFAAFYVAGWTGSKCGNNPPPPFAVKKGAIWGHYVKYVDTLDTGGTQVCNPTSITPCVPVLTR
jgi:Putative Flp pilus-assembly TadE/G-like